MMSARLFALIVLLATPLPARTQAGPVELLTPSNRDFVAPGRLFKVELPPSWQVVLTHDPYTIQFAPQEPGDAILWLRRIVVPRGAHPRQLALNAIDTRLRKMPHFKVVGRRDTKVAGYKGAAVIATYAWQGNIQFPRALEEVFVVVGTEAFIFHFECFEPYANQFARTLNDFYLSFVPRPAVDGSGVFSTEPKSDFPEVDRVKF